MLSESDYELESCDAAVQSSFVVQNAGKVSSIDVFVENLFRSVGRGEIGRTTKLNLGQVWNQIYLLDHGDV
jgi:hypothetical protein